MWTTSKRVTTAAVWALGVSPAWAGGAGESGVGVWMVLFLAFGALVIVFQAVPAAVLFGSLLRSLFARRPVGAEAAEESRKGT